MPRKKPSCSPVAWEPNMYDRTRRLTLTLEERTSGWEITECINCEQGRRRVQSRCDLCGGMGLIRVLNPERSVDRADGTFKRGGRPKGSKNRKKE